MDEALELGRDMLCRVDEGGAVWDVLAGGFFLPRVGGEVVGENRTPQ